MRVKRNVFVFIIIIILDPCLSLIAVLKRIWWNFDIWNQQDAGLNQMFLNKYLMLILFLVNLQEKPSILTVPDLVKISIDIAKGCQYLEERHFIHR